nr:Fur family transcriptional regulator [Azospirillum soli]
MPSRLERACAERGLKMTGQRRVIARVLSESADHPDVEEVYRRAAEIDSAISLATVYRSMRLFEDIGIIQRHDFGDGRARYEEARGDHHHHLIDIESGEVVEFQDAQLEAAVARIARDLGFDLIGQRLEIFGRRTKSKTKGNEPT